MIKVRRYRAPLPGYLEKPDTPIRVVMFGDLHDKIFRGDIPELMQKIQAENPDLILSVGDLTVVKPGKKEVRYEIGAQLLKELSRICPVYAAFGNHEYRTKIYSDLKDVYEQMKIAMKQANVCLLEDEEQKVIVKGVKIAVYGYELPMNFYKKINPEMLTTQQIKAQIGEPAEDSYSILIAHNPMFFPVYADWGAQLVCSGHVHGGLIRLPFLGGLISPQARLFPRYCCGLYQHDDSRLCVTAGLGSHSSLPRINNPAEFSVVDIY